MNMEAIRKALKPKLHKIDINGIELYIHRPTIKDAPECDTVTNVILLCVKDENGNPVFTDDSTETSLVHIDELDQILIQEIYIKVLGLVSLEDSIEDIEKK